MFLKQITLDLSGLVCSLSCQFISKSTFTHSLLMKQKSYKYTVKTAYSSHCCLMQTCAKLCKCLHHKCICFLIHSTFSFLSTLRFPLLLVSMRRLITTTTFLFQTLNFIWVLHHRLTPIKRSSSQYNHLKTRISLTPLWLSRRIQMMIQCHSVRTTLPLNTPLSDTNQGWNNFIMFSTKYIFNKILIIQFLNWNYINRSANKMSVFCCCKITNSHQLVWH